jgi:hypothetical protein
MTIVKIFQVLFLIASIVLIVLNVIQYNKYREAKKHPGSTHLPAIRWFDFILTSIVAAGCALNIIITWISNKG